ncbi:MAG: RNA helicase, partial [Candidatus Aenigmarchaeota archaeon]|nr:RNA helicase [Candidatus Aenigmarchaeota archaeon]
ELITKDILKNLSSSELAAVLCAVVTEESRKSFYPKFKVSKKVNKTFYECRALMKKIWRIQQEYDVTVPINLNFNYSAFIEQWVLGADWEELLEGTEIDEGDIVRIFKRTIDLLRQLAVIQGVDKELAKTASIAIDCINRNPVKEPGT